MRKESNKEQVWNPAELNAEVQNKTNRRRVIISQIDSACQRSAERAAFQQLFIPMNYPFNKFTCTFPDWDMLWLKAQCLHIWGSMCHSTTMCLHHALRVCVCFCSTLLPSGSLLQPPAHFLAVNFPGSKWLAACCGMGVSLPCLFSQKVCSSKIALPVVLGVIAFWCPEASWQDNNKLY